MNKFEKKCPTCETIINYKKKYSLDRAIKNNSKCKKCLYPNYGKGYWKNYKRKIINKQRNCPDCGDIINYKYNHNYATAIKNNSNCKKCIEQHHSNKLKGKFVGENNPNYGNGGKIKGNKNPFYNKKHTNKTKQKLRSKALERLLTLDCNNEDKGSFEYFEKLNPSIITSYALKDIGYIVDGYDIVNNIVYEYDTKYHNKPKQKEKDLVRENNIINYFKTIGNPLNAFIRIKSETKQQIINL